MNEAECLCDRVAIIDYGKIIASGVPAELIARLSGHQVVEFTIHGGDRSEEKLWSKLPVVQSVRSENGFFCLEVDEPHRTTPTQPYGRLGLGSACGL